MDRKNCSKCLENKELIEFVPDSRLKSGYAAHCKLCKSKQDLEYKARTQEQRKLKNREYYEKHKTEIYIKSQVYKKSRPEKTREYGSNWEKRNRGSRNEAFARYRARKKNAAIGYDQFKNEIKEVYNNCPKGLHVDHIIPLGGVEVCGLHVPWNLQYLTPEENSKKNNRIWQP